MTVAFPTHIQIQTTTTCGAACSICPHPRHSPNWPNRAMRDALFDAIVEQLRGREIEYLCPYLMADPLADPKIFDRTARLRDALPDAHIELSTTGLYLSARIADRLLDAPLSELRISSHGISAAEYARTMPGVNFERAMANIEQFIEAWQRRRPFPLSIVSLWGLWSPQREQEIGRFWQQRGVELNKWRVVSRARHIDLTVFGEASPDPTRQRHAKHAPPYACRFDRDTRWLHILSDGRVALCCMDYGQEQIVGDVSRQSIADVWHGEQLQRVRMRISGETPAEATFLCNRCEWHVSRPPCSAATCESRPATIAAGVQ